MQMIDDDDHALVKSNPQQQGVEEAPYYESRVQTFIDLYESSSMELADEFFDDIKLRDFFGCESRDFMSDGLPSYREQLINHGYREYPCPWLHGKLCFPVKNRWCEATEVVS